jgi:hypothetical protein
LLGQKSSAAFILFVGKYCDIRSDEEEVADLRSINKADLIAYFDRVVALNAPERKKLAIMVYSHQCNRDPKAVQSAVDELCSGDAKVNMISQVRLSLCCMSISADYKCLHGLPPDRSDSVSEVLAKVINYGPGTSI